MKIVLIFISFLAITGLQAQSSIDVVLKTFNENSVPYISVTEARMLQLQGKATIVDAREREEFEVSAIASATHVDSFRFSSEEFEKIVPNKNELIIVYCSIGVRSEDFAERLKNIGYTQVKNLYGGIFEWKNKEYPLVDLNGKTTDSVHTFSKTWEKYLEKGIKVN